MFTRKLNDISKNDTQIAGGKGASLGEMMNSGIPVPEGFVVLSSTFDHFISEADLTQEIEAILKTVDHNVIHTVDFASEKIQSLIFSKDIPEDVLLEITKSFDGLNCDFVAVRSSATSEDGENHAWAGQLDSFLNTSNYNLIENVKKCWASLFTPRAIFYRFEKKLDITEISVAIVIQKMVQSEFSGIAFSVHPITEDKNQLIIEAGFGLGEAIVSGSITPDNYVVSKNPRKIIDKNVNSQTRGLYKGQSGGNIWFDIAEPKASSQVLNDEQIIELSDLIIKIEHHYGFPCDIEWAFENNKFYIVQSRPITTLQNNTNIIPINKNISHLGKFSDYQRLFQVKGLRFFMDNLWMTHYKNLEVLVTYTDDTFTSYLPRSVMEGTLQEGLELMSSDYIFSQYESDFSLYIKESDEFANALDYSNLNKSDVYGLIDIAKKLYTFYSKTEFFYTDKAYLISTQSNDLVLSKNVKKMESIKNNGREFLTRLFFGENAYLNRMLAGISLKFDVGVEILHQYSPEEVLGLFDGSFAAKDLINERNEAFYILGMGNLWQIVTGTAARENIGKFSGEKISNTKSSVIGVSAHGGVATGLVRKVIYDFENFDKVLESLKDMKEGEVLIAETTSPELMIACKKASAIVTDQGGLLSHAAIVSRELNIPCIVGTGNATSVFNTGDFVEVDADSGIIKLINK